MVSFFWPSFCRGEALPSKKQQQQQPSPGPKQKPAKKSEPPSSIPSWSRHPFTRFRWFRRRIRAQRWDYDQSHSSSLVSSLDEPSPGLPERPSFFRSPSGYFHYWQLVDFLSKPRQRSIREMLALKGLEVQDLYNLFHPPPSHCRSAGVSQSLHHPLPSAFLEDRNLSEIIERALTHFFWAIGWLSDRQAHRTYDWIVKHLLWKKVHWIRRAYVWWARGNMAWSIECYGMGPVPCSALALRADDHEKEADRELFPVVKELERAQRVILRAIAVKGTGQSSVKCSVGDLAQLYDSLWKVSWRMSRIYLSIAVKKLRQRFDRTRRRTGA
ncbi:hypothetical protein PG987_003743 [Apiospora arundinis]|uniref:Uncharacterized protein n=1 Tax=Apiospora arundinis TaxID=335852 RepID=A0ABR2J728_9PEZI